MKKILVILFVLISNLSYGQTLLDSLIFNRINEYRESNCLKRLTWSPLTYKVGENQTEYMYLTNFLTHNQIIPIDSSIIGSFKVEKNFDKRFSNHINEEFYTNENIIVETNIFFGENLYSNTIDTSTTLEFFATSIVNDWINSPEHNELLLDESMIKGSISNKTKNNVSDYFYDIDSAIFTESISNKIYIAFECFGK